MIILDIFSFIRSLLTFHPHQLPTDEEIEEFYAYETEEDDPREYDYWVDDYPDHCWD